MLSPRVLGAEGILLTVVLRAGDAAFIAGIFAEAAFIVTFGAVTVAFAVVLLGLDGTPFTGWCLEAKISLDRMLPLSIALNS